MRKFIILLAMVMVICGITSTTVYAKTNPPIDEIKEMISKTALDYDIPPEILKAIAHRESGYRQFNTDGEPIISHDGGIGMMQITPNNIDIQVDEEQLKNDMEYNIEIGAQVLNNKWNLSFLPDINDMDRNILENWYFAIMAYNGLSKVNDPNLESDKIAYQEAIYNRIERSSLLYLSENHFEFPSFDIRYEDGDAIMKFPAGVDYTTNNQTPSQQMYEIGDVVYIDERDNGARLRENSIDSNNTQWLIPFTPLYVIGDSVETSTAANDYNFYYVKGVDVEGYVSSAYLNKGNENIVFKDPMDDERAAALAFLSMNGYVTGYADGNFGSNNNLKREHVAVILDRILDMDMPNDYKLKANDVSEDHIYYEEIAKAEYNGYLGVGGKIRPDEFLTRAQMADVLVRAFGDHYEEAKENHTFKDQTELWNYDTINQIYYNDISNADPFRPTENITRSQFALFLYRTLVSY